MLRKFRLYHTLLGAVTCGLLLLSYAAQAQEGKNTSCTEVFSADCDQSFLPKGAKKQMHYYSSLPVDGQGTRGQPKMALITIHGFKHTIDKTFNATLLATKRAGKLNDVLVISPIFHADEADPDYQRCMNEESPKGDQVNDLIWTCQGWMEGAMASNDSAFGSFDALDALVDELKKQWPSIERVTIAGFSAGGQVVQRYIGYANERNDIEVRYVISDPGSWFYFDPQRPLLQKNGQTAKWAYCVENKMQGCDFVMATPDTNACPSYNTWKYGTTQMPTHFKRTLEEAKHNYSQANIYYMQGALDSNDGAGTAYKLLDKSCSAMLQGPFRMQRGLSFAAYDRALIAPEKNRNVIVVPDCKHDVTCVFSSEEARPILFGE